jgi:hypothetical protein
MNRRQFIKKGLAATAIISGTGMIVSSCSRDLRSQIMETDKWSGASIIPDEDRYRILYYASLAPSGHNAQPWYVKIISKTQWMIGSDPQRWLPQVDGSNRETLLSIGAFIENLFQAADAFGYSVQIKVVAKDRFDPEVALLSLTRSKPGNTSLKRLSDRRTVKNHLLPKKLDPSDIDDFSKVVGRHLFYFPAGTAHAKLMEKEAVDNYIIQSKNIKATQELASWVRFKDDDIRRYRDGLSPDGMEIEGLAGWYARHFMDKDDVSTKAFIDKGIEKVKAQVKEGAGWLAITSDGNRVTDLIETGRRFQKMALIAREKMIAIHPMTQSLEEKHGQKNIRENHHSDMIPQFMLRVGYVDKYPDPVSLRRPVAWFVRV